MTVSRASYKNWRNIDECAVSLAPGINVLWGMNAQGKSNILEGIYYFARGRSFRGAHDRELIRFGCDYAAISIDYRKDGYEHDTSLEAVIPKSGKKKLSRSGAPLSSATEMMGSFRAVLFSPANLSLVSGVPAERRTFLDIAISQLSGTYLTYLRRYTKALAERNALLKSAKDGYALQPSELEVYSAQMAEYGAWISAYRADYTERLSEKLARHFTDMTGGKEASCVVYQSHGAYDGQPRVLSGETAMPDALSIFERLTANTEREIAAGTTLWGVHKDDILFSLNGMEAKLYCSQGQQRSIALTLKLAEAEIARELSGEYPVILLDDVFSELDEDRRRYVLASLGGGAEERQIIVTSCEPDIIPDRSESDGVTFRHVENGAVE